LAEIVGKNTRKKVIFLDRDNTINEDPGYISLPEDVTLLPYAGDALRLLVDNGFELVVISNQSGVGRGFFKESDAHAVNARLNVLLSSYGVQICGFYMCFHHPDEECQCRKPNIALLDEVRAQYDFDPAHSYMIGDKESDVEFGLNAGIIAVKLIHADAKSSNKAHHNAYDLMAAARWIINQEKFGNFC